ncbi:arginase family protein [Patescibacteria group bacterium]|nr:arginase family protein [Patescibacteria group bacterium]
MSNTFDPNSASTNHSGIFGLEFAESEAKLVLLPVPWEATTSYGSGASLGPSAILAASKQVDLYDTELGHFYQNGIVMANCNPLINKWNGEAVPLASRIIENGGIKNIDSVFSKEVNRVNELSEQVNELVYQETKRYLKKNKWVGTIGGDHSSPFGAIKAHVERYPDLGILQIDAHLDLRNAYEGFTYSHASIMYNVITRLGVQKLVQVGIRDICEQEYKMVKQSSGKITAFFDKDLVNKKFQGNTWQQICTEIVNQLPEMIYISFDIDGLEPSLCPHTGTPVPGGLNYSEFRFLIGEVVRSGRKIIGFDLCEVTPVSDTEWDANVGSRVLFSLIGWLFKSNNQA